MSRIILDKEEVKDIRKKLGVSQNDLATEINVVPECVRRWENGNGKCGGPAAILLRRLVQDRDRDRAASKNGNGHRRQKSGR